MKRRILLADDSVTIQKVIELTFMDEDYEVRAVSNGDEALALLPEVNPDFVIADVHMPGANGYEVCRRSKQLLPEVPVLLLVGTFEPFDEAQTRAVGADSFLKKPFDSQELLQRVQELLAARAGAAPAASAAVAVPDFAASPAFPAMDLPPLEGSEALPELSAEPAWSSFELEAEPEPAPPQLAAPAAAEPFDREPSFDLEPDPGYSLPDSEPVFTLDDEEPAFATGDEVFGAPSELSLDETPQDRYIPEIPEAPVAAANTAGFAWTAASAPEPEPEFDLPEAEPLALEEPAAREVPHWATPDPTSVFAPAAASPPEPEPAFSPGPTVQPEAAANGNGRLSDDDVDRIARRVVELLGDKAVRDVAWEVIPDMAEVIIRDRLRELEAQVE
jgi:CheY-like chemotaxis protein